MLLCETAEEVAFVGSCNHKIILLFRIQISRVSLSLRNQINWLRLNFLIRICKLIICISFRLFRRWFLHFLIFVFTIDRLRSFMKSILLIINSFNILFWWRIDYLLFLIKNLILIFSLIEWLPILYMRWVIVIILLINF